MSSTRPFHFGTTTSQKECLPMINFMLTQRSQVPLRRISDGELIEWRDTLQLQVLKFVEAKKHGAAKNKILEVERPAHEACGTSCGATEHSHVYAMTIWGTRARLWKFDLSSGSLAPLFGESEYGHLDSYVDADSPRAVQIKDGLNSMKALPPSLYHGQSIRSSRRHTFCGAYPSACSRPYWRLGLINFAQSAYST